jgi:hypothetical protein
MEPNLVVQVDLVHSEPFQRSIARLLDVSGRRIDDHLAVFPDDRMFRREEEFVPSEPLYRLSDQLFVVPLAVDVCSVYEIYAAVQCGLHVEQEGEPNNDKGEGKARHERKQNVRRLVLPSVWK